MTIVYVQLHVSFEQMVDNAQFLHVLFETAVSCFAEISGENLVELFQLSILRNLLNLSDTPIFRNKRSSLVEFETLGVQTCIICIKRRV